MTTEDNDEGCGVEMGASDFRWLVTVVAIVIALCTIGCGVAWVSHPKEFVCLVGDTRVCRDDQ